MARRALGLPRSLACLLLACSLRFPGSTVAPSCGDTEAADAAACEAVTSSDPEADSEAALSLRQLRARSRDEPLSQTDPVAAAFDNAVGDLKNWWGHVTRHTPTGAGTLQAGGGISYTASEEELQLLSLAGNVYNFSQSDPQCWQRAVWHSFNFNAAAGKKDNVALHRCVCDSCMHAPTDSLSSSPPPSANGASLAQNASLEDSSLENSSLDNASIQNTSSAPEVQPEPQPQSQELSCALSFAGTDDIMDALIDLDALRTAKYCGLRGWHEGFAAGLTDLIDTAAWEPFRRVLQNCTRLVVVGHSLGGAYATMVAQCVNCGIDQGCYKPGGLAGVNVEAELYTWGAPSVLLQHPVVNGRSQDGAFKGKRFWNFDTKKRAVDIVPYIAQKVGYMHPRIVSVGLGATPTEVAVTAATDPTEPKEPQWADWFDAAHAWWQRKISQHVVTEYWDRMRLHSSSAPSGGAPA